jgi:mycothiol synthase
METRVVPDLAIEPVRSDTDLEAMVAVRTSADPDLPAPRLENLRQNLASDPRLTYLVARRGNEPIGCGFVEVSDASSASAHVVVVPDARRRGIGSALLAAVSARARDGAKDTLQGEIRENDEDARSYFERRGFAVVGGERAVALDLSAVETPAAAAPDGIRIVSRAHQPDVVDGMYAVSLEAEADIPGEEGVRPLELWRAHEIDRPNVRPDLTFVAVADDEVVAWAALAEYGADAHHRLTGVKRAWRRRGIATALKQAEIAAAKAAGFRRLVTTTEERNEPMRRLNEKLGYRLEPTLSTVLVRGPLL